MKTKFFTLLLAVAASIGTMFAVTIDGIAYNLNNTKLTAEVTKNSYSGSVIIPESVTYDTKTYSVTSIGNQAFQDCTGLTAVTIPNSVTSIGVQAFYRCTGLTSITIGSGVTSCGQLAFDGCTSLTAVHISDLAAWCNISCPNVGSYPLAYAHNLYLNGELVTDLIIPNGVTSIGEGAFRGCTSLTSITIPSSVTIIGRSAFNNCTNITSVTIGNSVTSIGNYAFSGCSKLTKVTINSNALVSKSYSYNSNIETIFGSQVSEYIIGNGVESIGHEAFYECSSLTSITIPNSVTSIGGGAFANCSGLTKVNITDLTAWCNIVFPDGTSNPLTYAKHLYLNGSEVTDLVIPNNVISIGANAFSRCTGLSSVTIPNSVISIGANAFSRCTGLSSVTIPNSVTSIGGYAFYDCSGLTSVTIPNSITSIGNYAFHGCSGLTTMTCNAITPPSCASTVFKGVNCSMIPLHVPEQSISVYKSTSPWNGFNPIISTNKFIIKYVNWDGTEILSSEVTKGSMPHYSGATPTREATTELTYTFAGWTPEIVVATKDATYTATYNSSPRLYTITWLQDDGSLIDKTTVEYGKIPTHTNPNPTEAETAGGYHTFAGWSPQVVAVTGDATYRATYSFTWKSYTITWLNEDGSLIDKTTVEYGYTPTHDNPTKPATAEYSYTFAGWTPKVVAVKGDATYTATFSNTVNKYQISANAVNGSIDGVGKHPYGSQVKLTAVPNYGYHFTQWSDGVTDNPRSFTLTQDTTFTAEFDIDKSGKCGDDLALTWTYDSKEKALTISGNGTLNSNYTFGVEAPIKMNTLTIGNEVTAIGDRAFYGISTLNHLYIGGSVESIGDYAFAECKNFDDITCYAQNVPTINATTFENVGNKEYIYLYVPSDRERAYQRDIYWGEFDVQVKGAETTTTGSDVKVVSTNNTAEISWPTSNDANTYTLQITKDGEVFCTLVFNSNGQLTGIAFAPSRDRNAKTPAATTSVAGMSFTITGLDAATRYGYNLAIKDTQDQEIKTYTGSFATQGYVPEKYTITFANWDGSELQVLTEVEEFTTPEYTNVSPTHPADAEYTYTFAGWTPTIVAVAGDATYTATYTATKNSYTVTWQNEDGSLIDKTTIEYGVVPTHVNPGKESTAEYTYTFAGWTPTIVAVTGDATYTATFSATKNKYFIVFQDEDGTELKSGQVEYGEMPIAPAAPSKPADSEYIYTFAGWTPKIVAVTKDATYTATYDATSKSQSIEDISADGIAPRTVMINGQILILRGDCTYTLTGQEVK